MKRLYGTGNPPFVPQSEREGVERMDMEAYEEWAKDNDNCNNWECENTWRAALEWTLSQKEHIDPEGEYPREAINAYDIEQELKS